MSGNLFTVGHSTHTQEEFAELLEKHDVGYLIDVRSSPFSKYVPQFNKGVIGEFLAGHSIKYFHMGKSFGARRIEPELYAKEGYVDFELVRASRTFRDGLENILKGLDAGNSIAFMCAEKCPIDCHRAIMVARGFELEGIKVSHILADGSLQTQEELNVQLLDMYFPDRDQITLDMLTVPMSTEEMLIEAYRKRNRDIGYHAKSSREEE